MPNDQHSRFSPPIRLPKPNGISMTFGEQIAVVETFHLSTGEPSIRIRVAGLNLSNRPRRINIRSNISNPSSLIEVLLATDAARRMFSGFKIPIELTCPYFPGSRQDRVRYAGEPLTAKVIANIINLQEYALVEIWDAHSDVITALIDRVSNRKASEFVEAIPDLNPRTTIVVSRGMDDARRASDVANALGMRIVISNLVVDRNTETILKAEVLSENVGSASFLIVTDVCDAGQDIASLGRALKNLTRGSVSLYTTHGIFSTGFDSFNGTIDKIYTPNLLTTGTLPNFVHRI
jgi:ribose-phosphate pyrophosphokinase